MTVAEQIRRSTGPFEGERLLQCWKNAMIERRTMYFVEPKILENIRVSVWDFVFIDGSMLTVRGYWE